MKCRTFSISQMLFYLRPCIRDERNESLNPIPRSALVIGIKAAKR